jgi:hypothetical protein
MGIDVPPLWVIDIWRGITSLRNRAAWIVGGWRSRGRGLAIVVVMGTVIPSSTWGGLGASGATAARVALADAVYASTPNSLPSQAAAAAVGLSPASLAAKQGHRNWRIGFDKESVDPTLAELESGNFHLGGYGLGPTRASTGPVVDGDGTVEHIYARAMAISNRQGNTLLLAALENQGTFAADKQGPYGLYDMRVKVSEDLRAKHIDVPVDMIVINADHSHAGPDLIGLWGGVPVSYLQTVFNQTVKALEQAYENRVPADLLVGASTPTMPSPAVGGYIPGTATPGENLVHSQFGKDTGSTGYYQSVNSQLSGHLPANPAPEVAATNYDNSLVDTQLRVLQAVGENGVRLGTLINYSAHADVMDSDNTRYSADWPGRAARATEQALGEPVAVTMVSDVGRSQPPRPNSNPKCNQPGQESCDVDKLDTYTRLITPWVLQAVTTAAPVHGDAVAGKEVFTREMATNPALLGVGASGEVPVRGIGAYRSNTPPWITGAMVGTFASAHRVGDVLLTANPGEAYPDIRFGVAEEVKAPQAFFTFGLANDQLGYLIAPASEYPWISGSNIGNDNSFFNVSAQYGDHLMCTQTAAAEALGYRATGNPAPYGPNAVAPNCTTLTATDVIPIGPTPQQPWGPIGDGATLPPPAPQ